MHRILHIIPTLACNGTTTQLRLLAAGLAGNEFEIHVAAISGDGLTQRNFQELGIDPVVIGRRFKFDPVAFHQLRRLIRRLQPVLVHTWLFDANTYGRAAGLSVGLHRLVASERHVDVWKMPHEISIDRWLAKRTARIVVNSMTVRDFYVKHGVPTQSLTYIPNAAATAKHRTISREHFLSTLGLPQEARLIAYLGPLTTGKRIQELIWATDQLKAVGVAAHLLIVGDGPLRWQLQRYARLNRVDDRVHFLGIRHDGAELIAHVDVLWQAGAYEGQSNAILEGMAAALPVVAADVSGNRELVSAGETGFLVPLSEHAGFARQTLPLLEDAGLSRRLGLNGQQHVLLHHRLEDMLSGYAKLYRELLA